MSRAHREDLQQQTLTPRRSIEALEGVVAREAVAFFRLMLVVSARRIHADLPQSWNAGHEAQALISCFELRAQLALPVCRWRSPLPTSGRVTLRQSPDKVTASAPVMKVFTTAHPLRRFVEVFTRWATFPCIKLEVDYIQRIDNEWADALSRDKDSITEFFLPTQRIELRRNDLTKGGQSSSASWNAKTRRRWFSTAFNALSWFR